MVLGPVRAPTVKIPIVFQEFEGWRSWLALRLEPTANAS